MTHPKATEGRPEPPGATPDAAGLNIAVVSSRADAIGVSLFDAGGREIACVRLPGRTGDVFHGHIAGYGPGTRYGLRAFGPWDPARGDRFNPAKLLIDPYAVRIDRPFRLHASLFDGETPNPTDSAPFVPKCIVEAMPYGQNAARPPFDWDRQVIYELHVRGFTMRNPAIPAAIRGTFAGLAHPAAIAHLTALGMTAVELMPTAAWVDERHLPPLGLTNYWGYNPVAFFAPDPRLAPGGWAEVQAAVAALQAAGIAVLLDVVLNHTGEGDHLGPTLSLRGLDNALYYRLTPDNGTHYVNDTGCGHTLALDRPAVCRLALDALRSWAVLGGVDGFRLDLATTLGRRDTGFDPEAPLLAAIAADPVLSTRAIIAEPWDIGPGGYRLGEFPAAWGEWNDRFRDTARRFWRGDTGMVPDLATRFAGSADVFRQRRRPATRSINFVAAHDGFTLADLVSREHKRNDANGEGNRDGTDANLSWNNGVEGPSGDAAIARRRARDVRALLATLLLARGTPMLSMGDECGRSQAGNNNGYAQDNEVSWFDWGGMDGELMAFTARLIAIRRESATLRGGTFLTGLPIDGSGIADVTWLTADGHPMTDRDWHNGNAHALIATLHASEDLAIVLHAGQDDLTVALPDPVAGRRWRIVIDSFDPARAPDTGQSVAIASRSVVLLRQDPDPGAHRRTGATPEALDRLAAASGIARSWWDIEGREHAVTPDTKRALLTAMRLACATADDVADSLHRLTAPRALPLAMTVRAGEPIALPVAHSGWIAVHGADGFLRRYRPGDAPEALAAGRYRMMPDDDPDAACFLTVAPPRCYLPADLSSGQRRFGVAAHLYSLRGTRDRGIGDFTVLEELATAAGRAGAALIGLNPLHALFATDRARVSPYHPSHRGFLDPIYIDTTRLDDGVAVDYPAASASAMVDYPSVWAAKHWALEAAFDASGGGGPALDAFIAAGGPALRDFACFEAAAATLGHTNWRTWPETLRHPSSPGAARFAREHARQVRLVCYMQYVAGRQLARAANRRDLPLGFYRDLAIGCAPDGAEAWSDQDVLMDGVSIGAPPDPFSAAGQVWCLPPPDPLAMAREGYARFAAILHANMRHAAALRIDHVMGLRRLFLVPDGATAADGAYLTYPFEDLLGQLTLESVRASCLVVGEDLGTVPDGMREALSAARVLSYRVLWFERDGPAFRPPETWPELAAACVSTHDLPTLRGWWDGADIAELLALGLLDPGAAVARRAGRAAEKAELASQLRRAGFLEEAVDLAGAMTTGFAVAVHALIAATPSALTLIQADDLANETMAVNLPGTDRERPNWRRRSRPLAATLFDRDPGLAIATAMRRAGRTAGSRDDP